MNSKRSSVKTLLSMRRLCIATISKVQNRSILQILSGAFRRMTERAHSIHIKSITQVVSSGQSIYFSFLCEHGGIGRRAGFRFQWETVQVQVLLLAVMVKAGDTSENAISALYSLPFFAQIVSSIHVIFYIYKFQKCRDHLFHNVRPFFLHDPLSFLFFVLIIIKFPAFGESALDRVLAK